MEEGVLCFCNTCKFLYIIDDEYVYCLIERYEIIKVIGSYGICVLHLEQMCGYI